MEQLKIVRTTTQLAELYKYLEDKEYVAYDTETTGLGPEAEIIGFSVCAEIELGWYVVCSAWDVSQQKLIYTEVKAHTKAILELLVTKRLIMQNAIFDCSMTFNNYDVQLMPSVIHDTLIGGHILNENRHNGLKERGVELYGEDARKEQAEMKASIHVNGGSTTGGNYELFKADSELIARYGAKDAILTLKIFYNDVPLLFEDGLDKFFYDEESMPLLRGPTYELNTVGLHVDPKRLALLKQQLETEILEAKAYVHKEIAKHLADKYPGTSKATSFNINAGKQLAWLLFSKLGNDFDKLTDGGREVCTSLGLKIPYYPAARRDFIKVVTTNHGRVYAEAVFNPKTGKVGRPKKIGNPWDYIECGKETLTKLASKYKWVQKLLEYKRADKLLTTYVLGIQARATYNVIRPSFLQHGTTSGRYASRSPNFQNLPRKDKRIKECIVSRPGKVFVGADYSQLEPRVFASFSEDPRLLNSFNDTEDFYSVIGMEVFDKYDCTPQKEGSPNAFGVKYPALRDIAKVVALSSTYGTTAAKMAPAIGKSIEEAQEVIDSYFEKFPSVKALMLRAHEDAKRDGKVNNLFGRPRRMPQAKKIPELYGKTLHEKLPYEWRNLLNLAINHTIQSTGASIVNRAAVAFWKAVQEFSKDDPDWLSVKLVLQVHDSLIVEAPESFAPAVSTLLQHCMENTVELPGVKLEAVPKIGTDLSQV